MSMTSKPSREGERENEEVRVVARVKFCELADEIGTGNATYEI